VDVKPDPYPDEFQPRVRVGDVDSDMCPLNAVCSVCGAEWRRPGDDREAATLPIWAREHRHDQEGPE
jgi:hypothetical protein